LSLSVLYWPEVLARTTHKLWAWVLKGWLRR